MFAIRIGKERPPVRLFELSGLVLPDGNGNVRQTEGKILDQFTQESLVGVCLRLSIGTEEQRNAQHPIRLRGNQPSEIVTGPRRQLRFPGQFLVEWRVGS